MKGGRKGAQTKVFARKKFWRRAFHPLDDDPTVLRPALRVRTHGGWLHRMNRMHTPDTAERRGGLKATARPARSGRRDRNGRSKPGVDLSHQTLAAARNPKGFGGDWPVRSSCLAEWGSTTEPLRGSGAEGGQRPTRSSGSGHQKTAADEKGNPLDSGVFREFYDRVSEPTPTPTPSSVQTSRIRGSSKVNIFSSCTHNSSRVPNISFLSCQVTGRADARQGQSVLKGFIQYQSFTVRFQ